MPKVFSKLIDSNPNIDYCIGTILNEYDLHAAHASACYFIYGKQKYDELMSMEKLQRNSTIGLMMRSDPTLAGKLNNMLLKWFNQFCDANKIEDSNFVSSTRDSMLLVNKKPIKTTFENGIVQFRNKEGEYTSYIRLKNLEVLYDSMSDNFRIKGINSEYVDGNRPFIKLFKQTLQILENSKNVALPDGLIQLTGIRQKYLYSKDPLMYASIMDGNKYIYLIDGTRIASDAILPEKDNCQFIKYDNYVNFLLPLIKIYFRPH